MHDKNMIDELATLLRNVAKKAGGPGVAIRFGWLRDVLDGSEILARRVLIAAGYVPYRDGEWHHGNGLQKLARLTYPEAMADTMTDILDDHETS
ncbi:hypothetical protein [Roseovarius indicus]|uniref:hypothetical protein n=2 Tax=Roseovarius indicus TaxID=540747 RepID=UPI0007D8DC82|nr:hypothetical protein [Roseovarius indicus]OAO05908.1 hypothetical protein A8B76_11945 [Roseovarius indicus]